MKKVFLLAAIAGVALASCAKNEPIETPKDAIAFAEPVVGLSTKASEIHSTFPTNRDFKVYAHYYEGDYTEFAEGGLYMEGVVASYNSAGNTWKTEKTYYWPKQGTLTFAAYSPSTVTASYEDNGFKFTGFTVDEDPTKQFDLLFSERAYNKVKTDMETNNPYNGVQLTFNHALSSIIIKTAAAANYGTDATITLNKLEVKNVYSKGDFDQAVEDINAAVTSTDKTVAPLWSNHDVLADYVVYNDAQELTTTHTAIPTLVTTAAVADNEQNSHLILIPQELPLNAALYVEYTITNGHTGLEISQTATLPLATGEVETWQRGVRYIYNLTIGLDEITFNPTMVNWDEFDPAQNIQ